MKKILIAILFFCVTVTSAQKTITAKSNVSYSCSQKYGMTEDKGNYTLDVYFDSEKLKFKASEKANYTSFELVKKTGKYVIGKSNEGNYSFFDIKRKQFYYIDYYMKRHLIAGYGSNGNEIRQNIVKMMSIIKKGNSQKDAIQYLIKQTEYDF